MAFVAGQEFIVGDYTGLSGIPDEHQPEFDGATFFVRQKLLRGLLHPVIASGDLRIGHVGIERRQRSLIYQLALCTTATPLIEDVLDSDPSRGNLGTLEDSLRLRGFQPTHKNCALGRVCTTLTTADEQSSSHAGVRPTRGGLVIDMALQTRDPLLKYNPLYGLTMCLRHGPQQENLQAGQDTLSAIGLSINQLALETLAGNQYGEQLPGLFRDMGLYVTAGLLRGRFITKPEHSLAHLYQNIVNSLKAN